MISFTLFLSFSLIFHAALYTSAAFASSVGREQLQIGRTESALRAPSLVDVTNCRNWSASVVHLTKNTKVPLKLEYKYLRCFGWIKLSSLVDQIVITGFPTSKGDLKVVTFYRSRKGYWASDRRGRNILTFELNSPMHESDQRWCNIEYVGPYREGGVGPFSGSDIVPLAVGLCEAFGYRRQYLLDAAVARCKGKMDGIYDYHEVFLSKIIALRKKQTYYNRFGFIPCHFKLTDVCIYMRSFFRSNLTEQDSSYVVQSAIEHKTAAGNGPLSCLRSYTNEQGLKPCKHAAGSYSTWQFTGANCLVGERAGRVIQEIARCRRKTFFNSYSMCNFFSGVATQLTAKVFFRAINGINSMCRISAPGPLPYSHIYRMQGDSRFGKYLQSQPPYEHETWRNKGEKLWEQETTIMFDANAQFYYGPVGGLVAGDPSNICPSSTSVSSEMDLTQFLQQQANHVA